MKLPTWRGKLPQWNGKKTSKDAWKASLRTRSFRVGGYSVAAAAIVVVIAVVANLLVNALPAGATQFDISAGSMFTMSQETEQLLDGLDRTSPSIGWCRAARRMRPWELCWTDIRPAATV